MLILTRRIGESLAIDKDFFIKIYKISWNKINMNIYSPTNKKMIYPEESCCLNHEELFKGKKINISHLLLTVNSTVVFDDSIFIRFDRVGYKQARVKIVAPPEKKVLRMELFSASNDTSNIPQQFLTMISYKKNNKLKRIAEDGMPLTKDGSLDYSQMDKSQIDECLGYENYREDDDRPLTEIY